MLFIDEHAVGALRDVEIHPGTFGLAGASLSIGRNGGSAVSSDYPAPYPFTGGTITQVVVDISGEPYENLEKKLAIAFAKD
ncbi:arylsulfatase [Mycobacteroides abscessus]|uniref:arylsulfatase n=1 Tax=Mycobacteroides abscessus TaxID=36809 RepID=UPI0013903029|nr:arylsulfatase [Mycobacteroides abscessus]